MNKVNQFIILVIALVFAIIVHSEIIITSHYYSATGVAISEMYLDLETLKYDTTSESSVNGHYISDEDLIRGNISSKMESIDPYHFFGNAILGTISFRKDPPVKGLTQYNEYFENPFNHTFLHHKSDTHYKGFIINYGQSLEEAPEKKGSYTITYTSTNKNKQSKSASIKQSYVHVDPAETLLNQFNIFYSPVNKDDVVTSINSNDNDISDTTEQYSLLAPQTSNMIMQSLNYLQSSIMPDSDEDALDEVKTEYTRIHLEFQFLKHVNRGEIRSLEVEVLKPFRYIGGFKNCKINSEPVAAKVTTQAGLDVNDSLIIDIPLDFFDAVKPKKASDPYILKCADGYITYRSDETSIIFMHSHSYGTDEILSTPQIINGQIDPRLIWKLILIICSVVALVIVLVILALCCCCRCCPCYRCRSKNRQISEAERSSLLNTEPQPSGYTYV